MILFVGDFPIQEKYHISNMILFVGMPHKTCSKDCSHVSLFWNQGKKQMTSLFLRSVQEDRKKGKWDQIKARRLKIKVKRDITFTYIKLKEK